MRKSKRQRAKLSVDTALAAAANAARAAGTASPESSTDHNAAKARAGPSERVENKTRADENASDNLSACSEASPKATSVSLPAGTPPSSGRTTPTSLPVAKEVGITSARKTGGRDSKTATSVAKKKTLKRSLPLLVAMGASASASPSSSSPLVHQPGQQQQQQEPPPTKRKHTHIEGRWTKDEDSKLRAAVNEMNAKNWKKISQIAFGGLRSDVQCLHRWQKVLRPGLHKGPWSKEEDAIVLSFVESNGGVGSVKWSVVAAQVKGRLGKQVRERWYNHLDPTLKKGPWEKYEDEQLLKLQATMGNRWCEIAKNIPGRSENAVKNRWNSAQRRAKALKEAAAKREARAAELAAAGEVVSEAAIAALMEKEGSSKKRPRARRKQSGASGGASSSKKKTAASKARGVKGKAGARSAAKKRKATGAAGESGRKKKRGRKAAGVAGLQSRNTAGKGQGKEHASDLSVMADISTALQICEMRSNTSPGPPPSTRPTTPPTLNPRAHQVVNITAVNILAGAFERVTPNNQTRATPTPTSSAVEDVAASALLGLFF